MASLRENQSKCPSSVLEKKHDLWVFLGIHDIFAKKKNIFHDDTFKDVTPMVLSHQPKNRVGFSPRENKVLPLS